MPSPSSERVNSRFRRRGSFRKTCARAASTCFLGALQDLGKSAALMANSVPVSCSMHSFTFAKDPWPRTVVVMKKPQGRIKACDARPPRSKARMWNPSCSVSCYLQRETMDGLRAVSTLVFLCRSEGGLDNRSVKALHALHSSEAEIASPEPKQIRLIRCFNMMVVTQ